ncbi:hypothetical protein JW835_10260 [bacterium]|nr:hypothetical protein [bacterium]
MCRIKIIVICLFYIITGIHATEFSVYEANYPGVKDYNVNIDEAQLKVYSRGNYVEMNLYLTVSYNFNSWFFKNYDELEFLWQFTLPEHAVMHEFWIWFGDSVAHAQVLDKWTAELLFSDVSTPVRHPGLLTQSSPDRNGQVSYELKIFPLMRGECKQFMIQYLLPGRPSVNSMRAWLPTTQLISEKTSKIDTLQVSYAYQDIPYEPKMIGTEVLESNHVPDQKIWNQVIPLEYDQFVEMVLPSPVKDDFFFSTYQKNGEYFYHLAVNPPEVPKVNEFRNMLIVIDFNRYNSKDLDGEYLLTFLKETLQSTLSEQDSINIIVGYDDIVQGGNNWLSCTETNLDNLFSLTMKRSFPGYSYFLPLVTRAAEFIHQQSGCSEVIFFSNTDEVNLNMNDFEALADRIIGMFPKNTRLHFVDLDNKSYLRYSSNDIGNYSVGYYETQLQSFYGRMADATLGNLFFLWYHDIKTIITALLYEKVSHFERIEVQMRFQEGYAHSQHLMALHEGYYPLNTPIMQVGKFSGQLPMDVTVLGKVHMETVKKTFTVTANDMVTGGEPVITSWYGDHIRSLVHRSYDPLTVNDIIQLSIDQRILTPYTGFLIYHPDLMTYGDQNDADSENDDQSSDNKEGQADAPTAVEEVDPDSTVELTAFPNPFNDQTCLKIVIPDSKMADWNLRIYNILGQVVKHLVLKPGLSYIQWDATDHNDCHVSTGIYYAVLDRPGVRHSIKLIYMR